MKLFNGMFAVILCSAVLIGGLFWPEVVQADIGLEGDFFVVESDSPLVAGSPSRFTFGISEQHGYLLGESLVGWAVRIADYNQSGAHSRIIAAHDGVGATFPASLNWDGLADDGRVVVGGDIEVSLGVHFETGSILFPIETYWTRAVFHVHNSIEGVTSGDLDKRIQFDSVSGTRFLPANEQAAIKITTPYIPNSQAAAWKFYLEDKHGKRLEHSKWSQAGLTLSAADDRGYLSLEWQGLSMSDNEAESKLFEEGEYEGVFLLSTRSDYFLNYARETRWQIQIGEKESEDLPDPVDDNVADSADPVVAPARYCVDRSPVLLIHGLNSYPEMWLESSTNYVELLLRSGYSREFINLYSYSGLGPNNSYNNQGGVVEVAQGMRKAVVDLSRKSVECGGNGLVDIVAHSMGGLVARQYQYEYPDQHLLGKVITVGTPYQGSWLLEWRKQEILASSIGSFSSGASFFLEGSGFDSINLLQQAYIDLTPNSNYLLQQGAYNESDGAQLNFLYGEISVNHHVSIFNIELISDEWDMGDLIVSSESASNTGKTQTAGRIAFNSGEMLVFKAHLYLGQFMPQYQLVSFNPHALKYMHTNILKQIEVKNVILNLLL